jgi:hypothetical protein
VSDRKMRVNGPYRTVGFLAAKTRPFGCNQPVTMGSYLLE